MRLTSDRTPLPGRWRSPVPSNPSVTPRLRLPSAPSILNLSPFTRAPPLIDQPNLAAQWISRIERVETHAPPKHGVSASPASTGCAGSAIPSLSRLGSRMNSLTCLFGPLCLPSSDSGCVDPRSTCAAAAPPPTRPTHRPAAPNAPRNPRGRSSSPSPFPQLFICVNIFYRMHLWTQCVSAGLR